MRFTPDTRILEQLCMEKHPEPAGLVVFGASGDLTRRKLLPAFFNLFVRNLLSDHFFLTGFARTPLTDDGFRDEVRRGLQATAGPANAAALDAFCERCSYGAGDYHDPAAYLALAARLAEQAARYGTRGNLIFYLATPPDIYLRVTANLHAAGLLNDSPPAGWRRVVMEKPFGQDLPGARALETGLQQHLREDQIYRIDHYLGKETVQNIFFLRFANLIFEPLWNRHYIDHVQITVAESIGIGHRAGYFDRTGLLRDMFQNHMLQILSLVAMEPPRAFDATAILDEKVKVLRAVRPLLGPAADACALLRGQYGTGTATDGTVTPAYAAEDGVPPGSSTETYAAGRFYIDNWRWSGVPFYLRSGKRLARRVSEIALVFKPVPLSMFPPMQPEDLARNLLVLNIQPDEGIELTLQSKRPGPKLSMCALTMDFKYREVFHADPPDAYERLLLDSMLGDQTLFIRSDFIDAAWGLLDPVLRFWQDPAGAAASPLHAYAGGTWGPAAADALLTQDDRAWHNPA